MISWWTVITKRRLIPMFVVGVILVGLLMASPAANGSPVQSTSGNWKAVLVTGARAEGFENKMDVFEPKLTALGISVKRFYSCNEEAPFHKGTGWSVIAPAIKDADIFVYWGHGVESGKIVVDQDISFDVDDPRRGGFIGSEILGQDKVFKSNALVLLRNACHSAGDSISDPIEGISEETAKARIERFSDAFLRYGGAKVYMASDSTYNFERFLGGESLAEVFGSSQGPGVKRFPYSYVTNGTLGFKGREDESGYKSWGGAMTADYNTEVADVLPGFVPQGDPPPNPQPTPNTNGDQNFNEFILLQNPNDTAVTVKTYLFTATNQTYEIDRTVQPNSRDTIWLNEALPNEEVSAWVHDTSGKGIIAERSMYFDYNGRTGGSNAMGVTALSDTWYFAEGYNSPDFDSYILVGNPTDQTASVNVYFKGPGAAHTQPLTLAPRSRQTIRVNDMPGFSFTEFTAKVTSGAPVVAEEAMYFNYNGYDGGHVEHGVASPQETWYFAEGYTAEQFDTYVLVYNPGNSPANCTLTLSDANGNNKDVPFTLTPDTRRTFRLDDIPGYESAQVSSKVTADTPVIAERTMYFNYMGKTGGTASCGSNEPSKTWYLAEGYTAEEFDTYVLLYNPGNEAALVNLRFQTDAGQIVPVQMNVAPHSRQTVRVDDILPASSFSTAIDSNEPILVERAMYFNFQGKTDGHASTAVTSPAIDWYFGEGYTGD